MFSIQRWRNRTVAALLPLLLLGVSGCSAFHRKPPPPQLPNPLEIPVSDHEFAWNQIVDTIDDYFEITREERVRLIGNVLTEGRIETRPSAGASVIEFWRRDKTHGFQLWHGTFQSIRRFAEVRVAPASAGYGVQVIVRKELEDLAQPESSSIGGVIKRYDGSLIRPRGERVGGALSLGWIPMGRDIELEQKILADLYARMYDVAPPPPVMQLHR